jgi:hypothetical protein
MRPAWLLGAAWAARPHTLLTKEIREDMLEKLNLYRSSASLPPLRWSSDLARMAAIYAGWCRDNYNCEGTIQSPAYFRSTQHAQWSPGLEPTFPKGVPYYYVGETISSRRVNITDSERRDLHGAIADWYGELGLGYVYGRVGEHCTWPAMTDEDHGALSHPTQMTQLLWQMTTEVGCAWMSCPNTHPLKPIETRLVVCEYGPGGNLLGELPFGPSVANRLGLNPEPCDGPLTNTEWVRLEGEDPSNPNRVQLSQPPVASESRPFAAVGALALLLSRLL